jgi:hypothetical protein
VKLVATALAEETKRFDNDSRLDNKLYRQNNRRKSIAQRASLYKILLLQVQMMLAVHSIPRSVEEAYKAPHVQAQEFLVNCE